MAWRDIGEVRQRWVAALVEDFCRAKPTESVKSVGWRWNCEC